jgi:hypothetical protein
MISVHIVATMRSNDDLGSCGLPTSYEKGERQADMDGTVRRSSLTLEREEFTGNTSSLKHGAEHAVRSSNKKMPPTVALV